MEQTIKIAIVGYGNIGKAALEAVLAAQDFELAGVVRRSASMGGKVPPELAGVPVSETVDGLGRVDVALLCLPTRMVPDAAKEYLSRGISCVDSYDIHSSILQLRNALDPIAKKGGAVSVVSAGWDPGSDSMVRALMQAMAPSGITHTNFGPGMSMGHSVAARAVEGVRDALSMTLPQGEGIHRRMVYVELEPGHTLEDVTGRLKADPYFAHDETHVIAVEDVSQLRDMGHGVLMERGGVSGTTHNQRFSYSMRVSNPALTAQIMAASARACMRMAPGAYTMIELPVVDLLPGERDGWIAKLV